MARQTKGGDPAGQKYMSSFESFVNRIASVPKADVDVVEAQEERRPRLRRKPQAEKPKTQ